MVKVTFQKWEEVIIHESNQLPLEQIFHIQSLGVQAGGLARPLLWSEGILFAHQSMPPTEDVVREILKGKVHWSGVTWALMPDYKQVHVIKQTNVKIPINDVSASEALSEVARALKKTAEV